MIVAESTNTVFTPDILSSRSSSTDTARFKTLYSGEKSKEAARQGLAVAKARCKTAQGTYSRFRSRIRSPWSLPQWRQALRSPACRFLPLSSFLLHVCQRG